MVVIPVIPALRRILDLRLTWATLQFSVSKEEEKEEERKSKSHIHAENLSKFCSLQIPGGCLHPSITLQVFIEHLLCQVLC
jgi:hypothetical protein